MHVHFVYIHYMEAHMSSATLAKELESEAWIDFQDCDPFGHLNNARYLNYFMRARTEQLKTNYGFDLYAHTVETGNGWVVAQTHLAYLIPAKFNETVTIKTRLLHYDSFRLVLEAYMISQDRKRIHALGWIEFIYVNTAKGRPVKYDESLQRFFAEISTGEPWGGENFSARVKELQKLNRSGSNTTLEAVAI